MTFSQKYCLVQFLNPIEAGVEFSSSNWPPHCTIVGVFTFEWSAQQKIDFQKLVAKQRVFTSRLNGEVYFGPDKNIHVQLVEPTSDLTLLHTDVVDFIESSGGTISEPMYVRDGYRPHVTVHDETITDGLSVSFNTLALVDMFPDDDPYQREVIDTFVLTSK